MNVSCPECSTIYRVDPLKVPQGGVRARCSTCSGVITIARPQQQEIRPASDPIGDAFAQKRPTPAPYVPSQQPLARQTPPYGGPVARTPSATPRVSMPVGQPRVSAPPSVPRMPTPVVTPRIPTPAVTPRMTTPALTPRVPTPAVTPRMQTPPMPSSSLGASLPPLSHTPRTPWQPAASVPSVSPAPVSVPSITPSGPPAATPGIAASPTAAATPPAAGERRPINPFLARDPGLRAKRLARALVSDMVAYYPAKHSEGLEKGTLKDLFRDEIRKSYDEYVAQVGADFARTTTHFQESLNEVLGAGKKIF